MDMADIHIQVKDRGRRKDVQEEQEEMEEEGTQKGEDTWVI